MTSPVESIHADATLDEALDLMSGLRIRHLPVMDEGKLSGILSDRDLLRVTGGLPARVREIYQDPQRVRVLRVRDLAQAAPSLAPDDEALTPFLAPRGIDRPSAFVVLEDDELIGIVTEVDLIRTWLASGSAQLDHAVDRVMTRKVAKVTPETPLSEAGKLLEDLGCRHLPVLGEEGLVGIVSQRDILRARGRNKGDLRPVEDVMTSSPEFAAHDESVRSVAERMAEQGFSALPVMDGEHVVGIVTIADLLGMMSRDQAQKP